MKKKIVALTLMMVTLFSTAVAAAENENVGSVDTNGNIVLEPSEDAIIKDETNDISEIQYYMIVYTERKDQAHNMAEAARALGYENSHPVIALAQAEWGLANDAYNYYKNLYDTKYGVKQEEYPVAAGVWEQLKSFGWSNEVAAGIMGNMMAECGGNTLYLQPEIVSSNGLYYGLCQWQHGYADVWYTDQYEQVNFLRSTIEYEMNTYGRNYKWGFGYEDFLELNEKEVAEAFLRCYERGSTATLNQRKANAEYVLEFFTE